MQDASRLFAHQLGLSKIKVELVLGTTPIISGNRGELQRLLLNLALNAQQAMPSGGLVRVSTTTDVEGWAVLRVADDGPGIPPELRQRIFEPFFTTKPAGTGTGLGLAIERATSSRATTASFRSSRSHGPGATFNIRLPPLRPPEGIA